MSDTQVTPIARSAAIPDRPDRHSLDDNGNASRFADANLDHLRYIVGEGYAAWDGTRWAHDDDGVAVRAARAIADAMRRRAQYVREALGDKDDLTRAWAQHAKRSGSQRGIGAMVDLARSDLRFVLHLNQLDVDPLAFNTPTGTIDLRSGELQPHRREQLLSRRTAAPYNPDASAPTWARFLETVLPDADVRSYVQRMVGAAAVGSDADELLHVLHGPGANGKTKFVRTVAAALGDYAATAGAELLLAGHRHSAGQPELVRLRGVRLLVAGETDEGSRLNVALVKSLTGGDTIACRLLYANEVVEFVPVFSPWLVTNHRPAIPEQSEAVWRRVRLVPFTVTIPRGDRDPVLQGKLLNELPGVLAWIVEGASLYLTDGLEPPKTVSDATRSYRADESAVGRFVDECCTPGGWVAAKDLFNAWKRWCFANGEEHGTQTSFGRRLSELYDDAGTQLYPRDQLPSGLRVRTGLHLRDDEAIGGLS